MMKSLLAANRSEKDSFRIPHSVQHSIPIQRIYADGIWQVGRKHSKTGRITDISYAASSQEDRRSIFHSYGAVLNSLPTDATAKITIINRRLNPVNFQRTMLMPECGDGLDYYRGEYNQIILDKAAESNNLVQEKYITLSIEARKIEQTRAYFRRVDTNLSASFGRQDSGAYPISCAERLRLLHDFFRPGEEASFRFDLSANIRRGIDFRDLICPDGLQFKAGHLEMGGKFGRVLFMRDYASFISDEMIKDLSIHPNRLYPFCRSRLLRRYLQSWRITAHRYSYQLRNNHVCSPHRSRLHRQISGKGQIVTPLRGKSPEAALRFGRGKPCCPAPERCSLHLLYQEPRRRGHKKRPRRTPNGRCSKRAIPEQPELLPQRRKGWSRLRQKRQKS